MGRSLERKGLGGGAGKPLESVHGEGIAKRCGPELERGEGDTHAGLEAAETKVDGEGSGGGLGELQGHWDGGLEAGKSNDTERKTTYVRTGILESDMRKPEPVEKYWWWCDGT